MFSYTVAMTHCNTLMISLAINYHASHMCNNYFRCELECCFFSLKHIINENINEMTCFYIKTHKCFTNNVRDPFPDSICSKQYLLFRLSGTPQTIRVKKNLCGGGKKHFLCKVIALMLNVFWRISKFYCYSNLMKISLDLAATFFCISLMSRKCHHIMHIFTRQICIACSEMTVFTSQDYFRCYNVRKHFKMIYMN